MKFSRQKFLELAKTTSPFARGAIIVACALLVVSGCSNPNDPANSQLYRIPWPDGGGTYSLQTVKITSLTNPSGLSGGAAHILVNPYLQGGKLQGATPIGRFARSGNLNIPADYDTLQAVTLYAHLERLRALDGQADVGSLIRWPMLVGLQADVVDDDGAQITNNALYDGSLDALLVVPYWNASLLPISMNAGIVGHEHFHKIFQSVVLNNVNITGQTSLTQLQQTSREWASAQMSSVQAARPMDENHYCTDENNISKIVAAAKAIPSSTYNQFILRAMNEGFADFWGWVYTGDVNFIGESIPGSEPSFRRLDVYPEQLLTSDSLRNQLIDCTGVMLDDDSRVTVAYRLGTFYARFLRQLALQSGDADHDQAARLAIAKSLIKALPSLGGVAVESYSKADISPNALLNPLSTMLDSLNAETCAMVGQFAAPEAGYATSTQCQVILASQIKPQSQAGGVKP